ncbi:MAG: helix-turn-helix domain-containing protein [Chloroflexi bacterium]|nr:helix-turn-helix domain-containing protein [Chloroflexota bacterium]
MRLKAYLTINNQRPSPWARKHGIAPILICRYLKGKRGLSARTMAKIVKATGGLVTYEDLVAEMQEHKENIARLRCPGSEP